ncbi:Anthocyanidin 3-O-glucosyltransferase 5 [Hibiscus syriacus]|uniref:Anthocyanidin 3-O-glucosyltransferase 5 n=1 Tax=Hibiscus syriacus TaxID=106335 RepID=A0A6A2WD54_HIBSY|nr:Anthocyanidin 3-O-glucosyltransferase 5 [Hibiscus syriacus]
MEPSNPKSHIVLLSAPAHLTPVIELGKRLVTFQDVEITIFVASFTQSAVAESRMLQAALSTKLFHVIHLPPADISNLVAPGDKGITSLSAAVRLVRPTFQAAMSRLKTEAIALVVHVFSMECLGVSDELKIPKYVFVSTNAWFLAVLVYTPVLEKEVEGEYAGKKEPFVLPGCSSIRAEDLPDPVLLRTTANYREFLKIGMEIPEADGILVNTWEELQRKTLASLRESKLLGGVAKTQIFPVRPINSKGSPALKNELVDWLDKQLADSVLYISFGTIECITNGLPMIAWPLYSKQRMNATMLTEEMGIAVRSETLPSQGVVGREEIKKMVRKIFVDDEGREMRDRVKELKLSAEKVWSNGGSSYNGLVEMVECKKKC